MRIRIPEFHGITEDGLKFNQLPWASPCVPGIAGEDFGTFIVPPVGSVVWVLFKDGNTDYPVYIGSSYSTGSQNSRIMNTFDSKDNISMKQWKTTPNTLETPLDIYNQKTSNYPDRGVIFKSPKGHTIVYDDTDNAESFSIIDRLGQVIHFSSPVSVANNLNNRRRRRLSNAINDTQISNPNAHITIKSGNSFIRCRSSDITVDVGQSSIVCNNSSITLKVGSSELKITESGITLNSTRIDLNGGVNA